MSRKKEQRKYEIESRSWTKHMHTPKNVQNDRELFSLEDAGNIYMPSPTEHIKLTALPKAITDAAFDRILRSCEPGFFDSEPDLSVVRFAEENDIDENAITDHIITEEENVRSKLNTANIAGESSDEELEIINRFLLSKQEKKSETKWDTEKDCNIVKTKALRSDGVYTSTRKAYPSTSNGILTCESERKDPTTISKTSWPSTSNGPSTSAPVTDIKVCFAEIEQLLSVDNERNRLMFSAPTPPPYNRGMFKSSEVRKRTLIQNDPLNILVKYKKRFTGKIIRIENSSDIEIEQKRLATSPNTNSSTIPTNQAVPVDLEQYELLLQNIHFEEELRHQKELEEQLQQLLQKTPNNSTNKMDITKLSSDKQGMICRKRNAAYNTILASTTSLLDSYLQDNQQQPSSPASSSTSQTTGDTTFEPSIDMMVNDFDDEQTLTEEEALAELEAQDPADEITTLKKESEMPLEELLAHYTKHVEQNYERRHKRKKSSKKNQSQKQSKKQYILAKATETNDPPITSVDEVIVIEESDEEVEVMKTERIDADIGDDGSIEDAQEKYEGVDDDDDADFTEDNGNNIDAESEYTDKAVDFSKRSHLLELYPEKFTNINQKFDDDLSEDDEDDDDYDLDYVKKTIMVGLAFQATIPVGLSKYGDVLPYENEDKLIWEPSQVSEQEVEDYLMRVKEVKSSISPLLEEEIPSSSASVISESDLGLGCNLVKDDEQALHLLVQCGYNFKEALRRKRLNAVPLTGSMSLWSEEECRNFEEGIQKFGKDFRKIRQTQVRTRSIRELVQFYYLWKKTERRDQDVVDSDTVDHMDIYLDFDERDTGSNGGAKQMSSSLAGECLISNQTFSTKKQQHNAVSAPLSNFSIMNETKRLVRLSNHQNKLSGNKKSHNDGNTSQSKQIAHRRRNGLIANKAHHTEQNGTFGSKCKWDASLLAGAKSWRKHSNNLTKASPTNSSSTGIHCGKK